MNAPMMRTRRPRVTVVAPRGRAKRWMLLEAEIVKSWTRAAIERELDNDDEQPRGTIGEGGEETHRRLWQR